MGDYDTIAANNAGYYITWGDKRDLSTFAGDEFSVYWFDPRTGAARAEGVVHKHKATNFTPPDGGLDWVLVLDDAACGFPAPGSGLP